MECALRCAEDERTGFKWVDRWECGRETKHGINVVQLSHRRQHDNQACGVFFWVWRKAVKKEGEKKEKNGEQRKGGQ